MEKPDVKNLDALRKKRIWKFAWITLLILAILLITWAVIVQVKKYREKKALEAEDKKTVDQEKFSQLETNGDFPLQVGSNGPRVVALQKTLNLINSKFNLVPDGDFGNKTKAAVLEVGSKYYPVTAQGFAELAGKVGSTDPAAPRPMSSPANDDFPLKQGSKGDAVKNLQVFINKIDPRAKLDPSGDFDKKTYNALITYIGTKFYPVSVDSFLDIVKMASDKKAA